MTGPRDPLEAWLSTDVELLPPPPGAFERVHRRARHRRAMKVVTAAAGAAVVIAAGVTIPQLALNNGHPAPPAKISPREARPIPAGGPSALPGPPLACGHGPRPAARFSPDSVTFVGSGLGAVLGTAGSCGPRPCTAMAGTPDYGKTWTEIGAPPAGHAGRPGRGQPGQVPQPQHRLGVRACAVRHARRRRRPGAPINTTGRRVIDLSTVERPRVRGPRLRLHGHRAAVRRPAAPDFRLYSTPASSRPLAVGARRRRRRARRALAACSSPGTAATCWQA